MKQGLLRCLHRGRATIRLLLSLGMTACAWPVVVTGEPVAAGESRAIVIAGDRQQEDLDGAARYIEDTWSRIDPATIPDNFDTLRWRDASRGELRVGISRARWWLRADLVNVDDVAHERVILMRHPTLDDVRFWLLCNNGYRDQAVNGDGHRFSLRAIPDRHAAFVVTLPANARCTAIIAVTSADSILLKTVIADRNSFSALQQRDELLGGIALGMQCLIVLLSIIGGIVTGQSVGWRLALVVAVQAALIVVLSDLGYEFAWGEMPQLQQVLTPTTIAVTWWVTATLCLRLLPADTVDGAPAYLLQGSCLGALCVALFQVFTPDMNYMSLLVATIAAGLLLLLAMTVGAVMVGAAGAGFITAAIVCVSVAALVEAANFLGMLPLDVAFLTPVQAGFLLEATLLVFALWRPAPQATGNVATAPDLELNRRVAERTRELSSTVAQLTTANRELDRLSSTDTLTGTFNRRFMDSSLEKVAHETGNTPLSFILFDIDFFKEVNDRHGHLAGDRCLKIIADCVRQQLRDRNDILCRYGGEEFAVILPNTDIDGAMAVAEKIRHAVANVPIRCAPGIELRVTISLGVSSLKPGNDLEYLVGSADQALYNAKRSGRNRWLAATA